MKYIRTKDGKIYKTLEDYMQSDLPPTKIRVEDVAKDWHIIISKSEIIKQADTIEELCDEFVVVIENKPHLIPREWLKQEIIVDVLYGAIWTNKGLIYVAKLNDKGDLELI